LACACRKKRNAKVWIRPSMVNVPIPCKSVHVS
jgi:hypothetical protein